MFESILVPTDGSECASAAMGYARDLASRYSATVHVLSVVDSRYVETGPQHEQLTEEHAEIAGQVCDDLSDSGVAVERAVRTDLPHSAILRYASEENVDLIVMGTHGRTGVERYLLGSVTEKVLRRSDVPVLTIPTDDDAGTAVPFDDVLVPTDGSEGAEAAVGPAADIASTYGARIHALSVVEPRALGVDVRSEAIAEAMEDSARSAVGTVEDRAIQAGVESVETAVEHGTPHEVIDSYVRDNGIDLVVMGTSGHTGIEGYLLGSVAEKTVRTSPVPVMTVRRGVQSTPPED